MAEISTIARPYAEAVFDLAARQGKLEEWSGALELMASVAANPELDALIGDPQLGTGQLAELFLSACKGQLPVDAKNLLHVLIENGRLEALPALREMFEALKHEREGVVEAEIATAFPLDEAQLKAVVADLEARFKRKVNPHVSVDRELIGGVRVVIGDEVLDASVRGKLEQMSAALKN